MRERIIIKPMEAIRPEELMYSKRRRHKPDENESEIVNEFRKNGAEVWIIDWPYDLLVAFDQRLFLVEVKAQREKLNDNQKKNLMKLWNKGVHLEVVRKSEDVIHVLNKYRIEPP